MKKLLNWSIVVGLILTAGCGKETNESNGIEDTTNETSDVVETTSVWTVEPSIDCVRLELFDQSRFGEYPCVFDDTTKLTASNYSDLRGEPVHFPEDSCGIVTNDDFRVYDYNGEMLIDPVEGNLVDYDTNVTLMQIEMEGGNQWIHYLDLNENMMFADLKVINRSEVVDLPADWYADEYFITNDNNELTVNYGFWTFESYGQCESSTVQDIAFIVPVYQNLDQYGQTIIGIATLDDDMKVIGKFLVDGIESVDHDYVVNGFANLKGTDGKVIVMNMHDGTVVSAHEYDQARFESEGYIPVCLNDKWAYMNTEGTLVTDFVFDDAGTVFDGKCFVIVNGKAGILNLDGLVKSGTYIDASTIA